MVAAGIAHFAAMVPPAMHTDVGAIAVLASLALYAVPTDLGAIALLARLLTTINWLGWLLKSEIFSNRGYSYLK